MTIPPLQDTHLSATPRVTSTPTRTTTAATPTARAADHDAVTVDTIPASPPADVLSQIAAASSASDRLAATGHALHFSVGRPGEGVSVQLTDLQGTVLGTVTPSTALAVAAGGTLD